MKGFLELTRISTDRDVGTFGVLKWADDPAPFGLSLEDPWKNNKVNVSCIPAGTYTCVAFDSPTHGPTFIVRDVYGRTYILFHRGNTHIHTKGCILVGERFSFLHGVPSIAQSVDGFKEFYDKACRYNEGFTLIIRWAGGVL